LVLEGGPRTLLLYKDKKAEKVKDSGQRQKDIGIYHPTGKGREVFLDQGKKEEGVRFRPGTKCSGRGSKKKRGGKVSFQSEGRNGRRNGVKKKGKRVYVFPAGGRGKCFRHMTEKKYTWVRPQGRRDDHRDRNCPKEKEVKGFIVPEKRKGKSEKSPIPPKDEREPGTLGSWEKKTGGSVEEEGCPYTMSWRARSWPGARKKRKCRKTVLPGTKKGGQGGGIRKEGRLHYAVEKKRGKKREWKGGEGLIRI